MNIYRLVKEKHSKLTGDGGLKTSGRWHTKGHRIIYCAAHPAISILEKMAWLKPEDFKENHVLLTIEVDDKIKFLRLLADQLDPEALKSKHHPQTQYLGDYWLESKASVLLFVPSVHSPDSYNVLINPEHPDFKKLKVLKKEQYTFDKRLTKMLKQINT